MLETFQFHGFDIPERLAVLTGSGGATFEKVSNEQLDLLQRYIGISPDHSILEVGCGVGKVAIPLSKLLSPLGHYLGIDIVKDSIDWCVANISARYPNVHFICSDVNSHMYNPSGKLSSVDLRFPAADASVDRIFLWSVFTHMLEREIRHYLKEFKRVLKPNGLVLATWFVVEEGVLESVRTTQSPLGNLRFEHQLSGGCYVNVRDEPLGAVAYTQPLIEDMVSSGGLKIQKLVHGYWSNFWAPTDTGQDITILGHPSAAAC